MKLHRFIIPLCVSWTSAIAYAQNTDYLSEMPAAPAVVQDMRSSTQRDSASRASTALWTLESMLRTLAEPRFKNNQLTAAEQRRLEDYRKAREAVESVENKEYGPCEGNDCEKYSFPRCKQYYTFSAAFYRELLDRYFSPDWQRTYVPKLQGTLWRDAMALSAGTRAKADISPGSPCSDHSPAGAPGSSAAAWGGAAFLSNLARDSAKLILGPQADARRAQQFGNDLLTGVLGLLAVGAVSLLFYFRQYFRYIHLDSSDPMNVRSSVPHNVSTITGVILSPSKGRETRTHVSGGGANQPVSSSSLTIVHDQFFIRAPDGREQDIKLTNFDIAVREGQIMSAVWTTPRGGNWGPFLLLRNHSLRQRTYFDGAASQMLGIRLRSARLLLLALLAFAVYVALAAGTAQVPGEQQMLIVALLGLPSVIAYAILAFVLKRGAAAKLRRFKREVDERMVPALDQVVVKANLQP